MTLALCLICELLRPVHGRGACHTCYQRLQRCGVLDRVLPRKPMPPFCGVPGCGRKRSARDLCESHLQRVYRRSERVGLIRSYRGGRA